MDRSSEYHEGSPRESPSTLLRAVLAALAVWLIFRYAWGIVLPFLLAWLLSCAVRPLVRRLCQRTHLPRGLAAGALVTLLVGSTVLLAARGIRRGVRELGNLIGDLAADKDGLLAALGGAMERARSISAHIPFLRRFEDAPGYADLCARLDSFVSNGVDRLVGAVGDRLPTAAMAVAGRLPGAFIFVTVMLLACYYFSADDGRIGRSLSAGLGRVARFLTPPARRGDLPALGERLRRLGSRYVRTYLLLGLFTFLEVFIGLSVLGVRYAFLLAGVIALVDVLPLLGTGVILVPWAAISFLMGEGRLAIGLLILFGICTLLRQILEPRLLGHGLGLHPLGSLLAMYAGLKLFGVWGMLLFPLVAAGIKELATGEGERDVG